MSWVWWDSARSDYPVYRDTDLELIAPTVNEAKKLWKDLQDEKFKKDGDTGSCILGAGISVNYLGPRKRKAVRKLLFGPSYQGCGTFEPSVEQVVQFLKEKGVEAYYFAGRMD